MQESSGEAIVFLDSDDLLSEQQVEASLEILATAEHSVGFVYPDMQFFGNERDLVVMPPYNFYLLLHRNFCGMGSLIDRSVFDAGNRFRTELVNGHEDWDFFVTLGKRGIFGTPMHGHPLRWRRWGYSRSDSVHASRGSFLDEIQTLHPDLYDHRRLVEVKRRWAPGLSIVLPPGRVPAMAPQTCDDFEIVAVASDRVVPRVRGRWILFLDEPGRDLMENPALVERVVRLAERRSGPAAVGLARGQGPIVGGWSRTEDGSQSAVGVMMDAATYGDFCSVEPPRAARLDGLLGWLQPLTRPDEWWEVDPSWGRSDGQTGGGAPRPARGTGDQSALPPPPAGVGLSSGDTDDLFHRAAQVEAVFRHEEAPPLYVPQGGYGRLPEPVRGFRDGLAALTQKAWRDWSPSRTRSLRLVCDVGGLLHLDTVDDDAGPPATAVNWSEIIGRVWVRPFPGTATLYSRVDIRTHARTYRVAEGPPTDRFELPIGYVTTEPLPGTEPLTRRLEEAVRVGSSGRGPATDVTVTVETEGAYLERAPARGSTNSENGGAVRRPTRRWPLYEVATAGGGYLYTRSPDACMAPGAVRPSANMLVLLSDPPSEGGLQALYEVRFRETGGVGYVSGAELAASIEHLEVMRLLGDVSGRIGPGVPLVRLHPRSPEMAPPGHPGHRLASDWRTVEGAGYVVEGVVGFGSPPVPGQAPMYRWRQPSTDVRCLTLGGAPTDGRSGWVFEGTLGLVWQPGTTMPGLIDLWEFRRPGSISYGVRPEEEESRGFTAVRVVARVWRDQKMGLGLVPLHRFSSGDGSGSPLVTISTFEGATGGLTNEGILGYVEPAVPPSSGRLRGAEAFVLPDWAAAVDRLDTDGNEVCGLLARDPAPGCAEIYEVAGSRRLQVEGDPRPPGSDQTLGYASRHLAPFAEPLYLVRHEATDRELLSSHVPDHSWQVTDVRAFLFGEGSVVPTADGPDVCQLPAEPPRGRRAGFAASALEVARRSGLASLLPTRARAELRRRLSDR